MLQKQFVYYNLPNQSFDSSSLCHLPLINSIDNETARHLIQKELKEIAELSRTILFNFYLETAADQRKEYKMKYETEINQMLFNQQSNDQTQKLSPIMIQLMNERCEKISERIKYIYKFKSTSSMNSKFQQKN